MSNPTLLAPALIGVFLALCTGCAAENAAAPQFPSLPADGKIVLRDYGNRDWGPEPVHYRLDPPAFPAHNLVLIGPDGGAVPFQIERGVLCFVASVGRGKSATYTLRPSPTDRSAENSSLAVEKSEETLTVSNEHFALRLPARNRPGATTEIPPPKDASDMPPPMLGWKRAGGKWMGGASFHTDRKIFGYSFRTLRSGPAVFEYEARYRFFPRGTYACRIRVADGVPVAQVTEEFDMGEVSEGRDFLCLRLGQGWEPQTYFAIGHKGEKKGLPPMATRPLPKLIEQKRKSGGATGEAVGGVGTAPAPHPPAEGMVLLDKVVPGGKWGGYKGGIGLSPEAGRDAAPVVGLVPLHTGSWRRTMALNVWHGERGVTVALPLSVRLIRWSLDIADDQSPFSTHEHDRDLPRTYGRRVWGLHFGEGLATAQIDYGYVGLDRYKNWIVDYPREGVEHPRAFFTPEIVNRIKAGLEKHPDRETLRSYYVISGNPEHAEANARFVIKKLKSHPAGNWHVQGLSHYRQSQFFGFLHRADDALTCPELPAELRAELLRWLALYAHLFSEPDFNPRGAGIHLGNNNMTINRTLALGFVASMLPEHPCYDYWMGQIRRWARWKLASQTAPCGTWVACPTYQLYSPTRHLMVTQNIMQNTGLADYSRPGYLSGTLRYLANLTMRDPRFENFRIIPGMGNSANRVESIWGISITAAEDSRPETARWLRYFHTVAKPNLRIEPPKRHSPLFVRNDKGKGYSFYYQPGVEPLERPLRTRFFPAYGVMFRAHFGDPDETAMLLRAGMNWSHWDTDALNVVLYARGARLSPGTGYQYYNGPATKNNAVYHNQVKVGRQDLPEVFGRVDAAVRDYGFSPEADYALAERYYPPEIFKDGRGEMHWRRHVLFLKSRRPEGPNYFVMRDTFPGGRERKKWWNWLNLGGEDMIEVEGNTVELKTEFGASTRVWFSAPEPHPSRVRLTFDYPLQDGRGGRETKSVLEVAAGAGEDFFYVLYPHKTDESVPKMERPGEGCIRIETPGATDYAFLSDETLRFERDGVVFTGRAGAVRIYEDRVALCLGSGTGRVGYRGHVLEGAGPFRRVVALDELKEGIHRVRETYPKKHRTVEIAEGITVRGEGPFEAALEGRTIRIRTDGRARVLHLTRPEFMLRPQYYVDGREWMACWTDYPASGWGAYRQTRLIGLSVPAGEHELVVRPMRFPPAWRRRFVPGLPGARKAPQ